MLEEVLDGLAPHLVHVFGLLPVAVDLEHLVDRHREQLGVDAGFVVHHQHAERPARDDDAGRQRVRRDHEHVHRIAVAGECLRDVAVVARIVHRGRQEAIDEQRAAFLVHLVLDRVRVHRDFDDDVELVGRLLAGGNSLQAHGGRQVD